MRSIPIDVLRAVACLLVLTRHCRPLWDFHWAPAKALGNAAVQFGWTGVDLFFVLSGFLVSGLLFREYQSHGKVRVGRFLLRRGFKIYPAYYILLLVGVWLRFPDVVRQPRMLLCDAVFLQNYSVYWYTTLWPQCWSLAVEEHFYLGLAALTLLLASWRWRDPFLWLLPVFLVAAVGCPLLRKVAAAPCHTGPVVLPGYFPFATHLRIDALLFGAALSYLVHFRPTWLAPALRRPRLLLLGSLLLLAPAVVVSTDSYLMVTVGLSAVYLGYGGLFLVCLHARGWEQGRGARVWKALAWVGSHSYSIYLWHWLFMYYPQAFRWADPAGPVVSALVFYAECLITGIALGVVIEKPFLRWRDRAFPSFSPATVAQRTVSPRAAA